MLPELSLKFTTVALTKEAVIAISRIFIVEVVETSRLKIVTKIVLAKGSATGVAIATLAEPIEVKEMLWLKTIYAEYNAI